jgi:large subunit ribosomal protein L15
MGTELHTLQPPAGARKKKKRKGRGPGSGNGKTSGRGMKGQRSRNTVRRQFEGGQLPIHMRVPKRGFVNIYRVPVHSVNVGRIDGVFVDGDEITVEALRAKSLIPKKATIVKLLAGGDLTKKLTIRLHRASAAAITKVEAAGGTMALEPLPEPAKPKRKVASAG